jgi:hypothetical protein
MTEREENRRLYAMILLLCAAEYATWTASCYWTGDTIANAYFWFDTVVSVTFMLLPPALGKAVAV